jgi:hypothetical protein
VNRSLCVLGLAILTIGTPLARSSAVYSMGDPGTGTPVTSNFIFGSDPAGGGVLSFNNVSGVLWNSLEISVTEPIATQITILPGLFFNSNQFSSTPDPGGVTSRFTIGLFNTGTGSGGIPDGQFFTINLNNLIGNQQNTDPNGAGGWGPETQFSAAANSVNVSGSPEPASTLLVITGLGLVGWGSRRFHRPRAS